MRSVAALAAITLVVIGCGGGSTGHPPSPSPSAAATPQATPSNAPPVTSYGLLLSAGTLEMITPAGTIAAHASVAAPSVHTCGQSTAAVLQPPVSASDTKVYYRDGNTKIKFLTPDGQTGNVTTVPGSATKISFFSVSPDDTRIAVLVEDLSPSTTIKLSLYVEDLTGHTNHSVIFTNTLPKFKNSLTLWPMGWHQGQLVLAVFPVCKFGSAGLAPIEWHVANADTGIRSAKIGNPCIPSYWPSPAGVACIDVENRMVDRYDWTGMTVGSSFGAENDFQSGISPSGAAIFVTPTAGTGGPLAGTVVEPLSGRASPVSVSGRTACLWIDEDHILTPDAVLPIEKNPMGFWRVGWIALPTKGVCAGRFPGGL